MSAIARRIRFGAVLQKAGLYVLALLRLGIIFTVLLVLPLRWLNPITTAFILQDNNRQSIVISEWRSIDQLAENLILAVVAAEDQKFDRHKGIDFESIEDSFSDRSKGNRLRGASTITQQLVKNLYLWPERSYVRKGIEAWLALTLDLFLPKQRILELYLNVVEFGPGIYGVTAASLRYFGKEPRAITDREAALLAAVLPNPRRFRVDAPSDYVRSRQAWIVSQMVRLKQESWLSKITLE
jgi:monofunctional biosynthetic peptidoglycan transglycosylase